MRFYKHIAWSCYYSDDITLEICSIQNRIRGISDWTSADFYLAFIRRLKGQETNCYHDIYEWATHV